MKCLRGFASLAVVGLCVAVSAAAEEVGTTASTLCHCHGDAGPSFDRINQALDQPLKQAGLDFTEEPLETVVNYLQSEYEIPIQLDVPALEDAGLTPDEQVTVNLQRISLRSAMRLLLKQLQLTYVIRNEVLMITTPEEAESELVVCVYDVRNLLGGRNDAKQLNSLVDVIASCVAKTTWSKNGKGEAEIKSLQPGLLVVSQTQAVHEQISGLLGVIRETLNQPAASSPGRDAAAPDDMFGGRGGYGRGGYGIEGEMGGVEGGGRGMVRGRGGYCGGYGENYGGRGDRMQPEPTPADDSPFQ